jgi:iron complex transport system ATP-binding protein
MHIEHTSEAILLRFDRKVRVLSSASVGGGLVRTDLMVNLKTNAEQVMHASPEELVGNFLRNRGIDGDAVGLLTSADMEYAQLVFREDRGVAALAVITAGTSNALNISESTGSPYLGDGSRPPGTINIILLTNKSLADEAMVGSVIVATEAKSAALIDLKVQSVVTGTQATGTGTDTVAVVSGFDGPIKYAGGHTRYGQMLGEAVYTGVRRSLEKMRTDALPPELYNGFFRI